MYSREEKVKLRHAFWTAFGQYMNGVPVFDEDGRPKNWLNYKTGVRGIRFKTDATDKKGYIAVELLHKDADERTLVWEQFLSVKKLLDAQLAEEWTWEKDYRDEQGKTYDRIYLELSNVNVFREQDWPALISFFKPRILALDAFWDETKMLFEDFL
ncbi:MAG: DUF4268 domain-containing protein [Chitinophagaceae bacterium]